MKMRNINALPPHRSQQLSALWQTGDQIFITWIFWGQGDSYSNHSRQIVLLHPQLLCEKHPRKPTGISLHSSVSFYCFPCFHSCVWCSRRWCLATGHSVLSYRVLAELKEEITSQILFISQLLQRYHGQWKWHGCYTIWASHSNFQILFWVQQERECQRHIPVTYVGAGGGSCPEVLGLVGVSLTHVTALPSSPKPGWAP